MKKINCCVYRLGYKSYVRRLYYYYDHEVRLDTESD